MVYILLDDAATRKRATFEEPAGGAKSIGNVTVFCVIGMLRHPLSSIWIRSTLICFLVTGCAPLFEPSKKPKPDVAKFASNPLPPDKAKETIEEVGKGFIYGPGLGEAVVNGGTAVLFPPYAILLLGNAVLSLSGYEPITVSRMLPEEAGKVWGDAYDGVVSGPGRVSAALAGEEFRSQEVIDTSINTILESAANPAIGAPGAPRGDAIMLHEGRSQ